MSKNRICNNCENDTSCMYQDETLTQVLHCEDYELLQEETKEKVPTMPKTNNSQPDINLSGLCITCDYRENCCLRTPNSVIWHCEEYI